jgi:hypothetical protein
MKAHVYYLMALAMIAFATGCGTESTGGNTEMDRMAAELNKPKPAPAETKPVEPEPEPEPVAEKVNVEETRQLNPDGTYMGAIMAANRSMRNQLDDVAWKKSVQFYQATNDHLPRNTEEFIALVQSEGTPLPEIEEGHDYEYDPSEGQFGTLYEVTPAPQGAPPSEPASP